MTEQLGVALIGTGFMGRAHSHAWRNVSAIRGVAPVRLRRIVGHDPDKAADAAGRLGWETGSGSWRDTVARDDVHIVDICTPGYLHAEIAIAALDAGKHVLVEKPLADSLDDAVPMVEAAASARTRAVRSMVGFNYRRIPAIAHARELILGGRIGQPRHARIAFLQDWLADASAPMRWRLRKETAGSGARGDLGSHIVDLAQFLLGAPIVSVTGHDRTFVTSRPGPSGMEAVTVDDAFWTMAATATDVTISLEASRVATGRKSALLIEIYGSEGAIMFDLERLNELLVADSDGPVQDRGYRRVVVTHPAHPYLAGWWPPGHMLGWENTFTDEIGDFLQHIERGSDPSPSFEDALQVERVLAGIGTSARLGVRVEV